MRRIVFAALLVLVAAVPAFAHPVPFSYLDLRLKGATLEGTLVVHIFDLGHDLKIEPADRLLDADFARTQADAIAALLGPRMKVTADGRELAARWSTVEVLPDRQSVRVHLQFDASAPPGRVGVEMALFPYDDSHQAFVNVYEGSALTQAILDRAHPRYEYLAGSSQGVAAVVTRFVPAGLQHILIGPDHLLFLVGLLLLGGSIKRLAVIVTAFTVAHSLTLSLAALNIVSPPARFIEPAIALSIVYVGADNLLIKQGRDVRTWIAFGFGFIHGFGFANVLREMDLPSRALGWSLFSFNVGVEIGQLLVVVAVATALSLVRSRSAVAGQRLAFAGSLVVMAAGAFWFVQRVFGSGGVS